MRKQITLILLVSVLFLITGCTRNDLPQETENSSFSGSQTEISETLTSSETITDTTDKATPPALTEKNDETTAETESSPDTSFSGSKETESSKPTEVKDEKPTAQAEPSKNADTSSESQKEPEQPKQTEPEPTQAIQIADKADVKRKVAEYINGYRSSNATVLSGLTQVARYRSSELVTNFAHTDGISACNALKYGEYVDMTEYGMSESDSYYQGYNREAIAKGNWVGSADEIAKQIADGFKNSSSHWKYLGSSEYSYMAVGCTYVSTTNTWYCCICVSDTNYGG